MQQVPETLYMAAETLLLAVTARNKMGSCD